MDERLELWLSSVYKRLRYHGIYCNFLGLCLFGKEQEIVRYRSGLCVFKSIANS